MSKMRDDELMIIIGVLIMSICSSIITNIYTKEDIHMSKQRLKEEVFR